MTYQILPFKQLIRSFSLCPQTPPPCTLNILDTTTTFPFMLLHQYSELLEGHNDEMMKQRTERKQKMIIAQDNRRNRLYAPVAEQFSNLNVKELKRPISPDRRSALKSLIKKDVSQWDQDGHKSEKLTLAMRSLDQTLDFSNQGNDMTKEELLLSKSMGPPRSRTPSPLPRKGDSDDKTKPKSPGKKGGTKKGTKPKKKSTKKKLYKPNTSKHLYDMELWKPQTNKMRRWFKICRRRVDSVPWKLGEWTSTQFVIWTVFHHD